jgi:hypothetical protein
MHEYYGTMSPTAFLIHEIERNNNIPTVTGLALTSTDARPDGILIFSLILIFT